MKSIKVGTFNINKDEIEFPKRIFELSDVIRKSMVDILCLQEDFNSEEFSSSRCINLELDYNYISTKTRAKCRNKIYSTSNLTILSRYPTTILDEVFFNKNEDEERAFQLVKINTGFKDIILVNTHLCHLDSKNRIKQLKTIINRLDKYKNEQKIICGDLNVLPSSAEVKLIKESGYVDSNTKYTHEDQAIVDYIFCKEEFEINIKSKIIFKDYSDHYCLIKTLKFLDEA